MRINEILRNDSWLQGSEVTDVLYHGTSAQFDAFDLSRAGTNTQARTSHLGIFATDNPNVAKLFAGATGTVKKLHMNLRNPLVVGARSPEERRRMTRDPFYAIQDAIVKVNGLDSWSDATPEHVLNWKRRAESHGWDGIIIQFTAMDGAGGYTARSLENPYHHFYIAFSPAQVRTLVDESFAGATSDILVRDPSQHAVERYFEHRDGLLPELIRLFEAGGSPPGWEVVPAAKLKSVWSSSRRYGFVRQGRALDQIADLFFHNIARLHLNAQLFGHSLDGVSVVDVLDDYYRIEVGEDLDEEYWTPDRREAFAEWACDHAGGYRYTDHGQTQLMRLACLLRDCQTDDETLMVCDAILNVVHPSNDLASWFVEGGSYTLSEIAEG